MPHRCGICYAPSSIRSKSLPAPTRCRETSCVPSRRADLAFDTLAKAEHYYLELYRLCEEVHQRPLRTVILCNSSEIKQVYELCKKEYFDDYILFWPRTDDSSRLAMTIHHSLQDLAALKSQWPSKAEFAAQARHLAELEKTLNREFTQGGLHIKVASLAVEQAAQGVETALDGFSHRLISGALPDTVEVKNADGLEKEISRFKREEVQRTSRPPWKQPSP